MTIYLRWFFASLLFVQAQQVLAYDAVDIALEKLNASYLAGRAGIEKFDCSGLTQFAFAHVGIQLPKLAADQALRGTLVTKSVDDTASMRRGDLLFFGNTKAKAQLGIVGHVGIYVGNGQMINALWVGEGNEEIKTVRLDDFTTNVAPTWWRGIFIEARRLPAPVGASTKFGIGDIVEVTESAVNIRGVTDSWGTVLGSDKTGKTVQGVRGRITSRPVYTLSNWYWRVNFDSGDDGWVAEGFLRKPVVSDNTYFVGVGDTISINFRFSTPFTTLPNLIYLTSDNSTSTDLPLVFFSSALYDGGVLLGSPSGLGFGAINLIAYDNDVLPPAGSGAPPCFGVCADLTSLRSRSINGRWDVLIQSGTFSLVPPRFVIIAQYYDPLTFLYSNVGQATISRVTLNGQVIYASP